MGGLRQKEILILLILCSKSNQLKAFCVKFSQLHVFDFREGETETLETTKQDKKVEVLDSSIDLGVLKFQPLKKVEFDDLHARPESGEIPNKLIASLTEAEINEVRFIFNT